MFSGANNYITQSLSINIESSTLVEKSDYQAQISKNVKKAHRNSLKWNV